MPIMISIHAPSRERHQGGATYSQTQAISIHAPSRERHGAKYKIPRYYHFNPRSLTGATIYGFSLTGNHSLFQSTLPHGSDLFSSCAAAAEWHFNPRSLTGATGYNLFKSPTLEFQSTLPHGSDVIILWRQFAVLNFNSRSLTGATYSDNFLLVLLQISIHAPSRERRRHKLMKPVRWTFQSTLPHGSDSEVLQ